MADKIEFEISKSRRATYLSNLTNDELYARYFKKYTGSQEEKQATYINEFSDEMNRFENGKDVYGYLATLLGDKLDALATRLYKSVAVYMRPDCILNAKAVMQDIETIMSENKQYSMKAAQNPTLTPFMRQLSDFMVENLTKGLENILKF